MMGLHHNYQVTWGAEKMEGLTLDLGLDGSFSPLPAELNPVVTKDSEPSSWRFFGQSYHTQQITDDNLGGEDPCAFLHSSNCGQSELKPDMFELSLSSYPPQARQQQQLINMKLEQEDVEPPSLATDIVPSVPSGEDLSSQRDGPFNSWRNNNTELVRRKELHLYGTPGDENSPVEFRGDDTEDFSEIKADRGVSSSVPTPVVQEQQQHPETIVIDDDDTDDEFLFEERYTEEDDRSVSTPPCADDSRRGSQERGGFTAVSQSLPLREIKRNVLRSSRSDEDFACLTPSSSSAVPAETTRQHYGSLKDINESCDWNQQKQGTSTNSKRGRGYGDHNWLPSDLLDTSHSDERRNEAKRARRNDGEERDSQTQSTPPIIDDSDLSMKEPGGQLDVNQGIQEMPQIDVNQAIQAMPQDTAEAFKELIRLVGASGSRASRALDEHWRASDVDFLPPPSSATVNQPSRALEEMMENMHCVGSDLQHIDPLTTPTTVNQASPLLEELESRLDELESRSMTSSDFQLNSSPPLATVDQPFFAHSPCHPSESANQSQCSPHRAIHEQQHAASKRTSNADVVLYEPKPEPVEAWRENTSGPVVHVKQEPGLHYQDSIPSDRVAIRPIDESAGAVGQCYSNRKLILTALNTFEQVRQQIIKDPTYGQALLEKSQTSSKGNNRRVRADLKAACLMRKKGFWLNDRVRPIGEVPGVVNGDCFKYRIEMAVIGLHRAVQAGIAVVPLDHSPYGKAVASSVVLGVSDPYQDDKDMGDTVEYSGQGGLCNRTKEAQDQKLERGNLALSNSYELKLPVRFIRGYKQPNSITGLVYSYDGLYQVVDMKYVIGAKGKKVFKFILHRLPGQPPIQLPGQLPIQLPGQHPSFSGYPAPLGSQVPVREPPQDAVHWSESADVKPLYLEKR